MFYYGCGRKLDWSDPSTSRIIIAMLAVFSAPICLHRLLLGNYVRFALSILFCWTLIPSVISIIDCIRLFIMDDDVFIKKYPNKLL